MPEPISTSYTSFGQIPKNKRFFNLAGRRFGRLVVESFAGIIGKHSSWNCKCDCGNKVTTTSQRLRTQQTKSCGCFHSEVCRKRLTTHGATSTQEFNIWMCMLTRCLNPKNISYANYGGRGITVCERWIDSFTNFISDMGKRPSASHSLDRIDNNGNYEASNCRWATQSQQMRNTRKSRLISAFGKTQTLIEWSHESSLSSATILRRLAKGMSCEDAIGTPRMNSQGRVVITPPLPTPAAQTS